MERLSATATNLLALLAALGPEPAEPIGDDEIVTMLEAAAAASDGQLVAVNRRTVRATLAQLRQRDRRAARARVRRRRRSSCRVRAVVRRPRAA